MVEVVPCPVQAAKAEPSRLMLGMAKIPFEDKLVTFADWPALKPKTPFGQLPFMEVSRDHVRTCTPRGGQLVPR